MSIHIDERMIKARSVLIMEHPFFGCLAMRLTLVERNDIPTMMVDGYSLWYSKLFLDRISEYDTLFVVAHEVLHCSLGHMSRRGNRDPALWNEACDYVVNNYLHLAGFKVPKMAKCFDLKYQNLTAEEIYTLLEHEKKSSPQSSKAPSNQPGMGTPQPGQSQDAADPNGPNSSGDPGGCGEIVDAAPAHDKAALDEAAAEWEVYVRQAANIARRLGEGKTPGFVEELIEELNEPEIDWRTKLRCFVDPFSTTKDLTWSPPNRRMLSLGYVIPGTHSDGINHMGFVVDSSGSMDTDWLRQIGGELQQAMDEGAIDKITVVFCDEQVHRFATYEKGELLDFTVVGRGGTSFAPAFAWVNEHAPDVAAVVYFTDLDCSSFGPEPSYPVLWAVTGTDPRKIATKRVPFGEVFHLRDS